MCMMSFSLSLLHMHTCIVIIGLTGGTRKASSTCKLDSSTIVWLFMYSLSPCLPLHPSYVSLQDPFQVWEESSTSRSLFSRAHERHVFLFEKMVIFSKKIEAPVQKREKKSDNYLYKGHLPVGSNYL